MTDEYDDRTQRVLLPCQNCGRELFGDQDGVEAVTAEVEEDFEFGGETATRTLPAYRCPDCGEVTAL